MNKLIEFIEKGKPFFEKISRNPYLRAIRDGFIAAMPVILFSSIFLLVAFVPNIFGFTWSDEAVAAIMKPYGYHETLRLYNGYCSCLSCRNDRKIFDRCV